MVDCLGTTANVKTGTIYTHPEIIGSMQKLRHILDRQPDLFSVKEKRIASGKITAEAQKIMNEMKRILKDMPDVDQKTKDTFIASVEASLTAKDFTFPVDSNLGMYGASMKGITVDKATGTLTVDLIVDPEMQKAIVKSFTDIEEGEKVSVKAITKAMKDFGLKEEDALKKLRPLQDGTIKAGQTHEVVTPSGVKFRISVERIPLYEKVRETFVRNNALNVLRTQAIKDLVDLENGYMIENGKSIFLNEQQLGLKIMSKFHDVAALYETSDIVLPDGKSVQDAFVEIDAKIRDYKDGKTPIIDVEAIRSTLDAIFFAGGKLSRGDMTARIAA
mgnify:FL=1